MNTNEKIAFALGGLAGNNAHGAGFLEAALIRGVDPLMISCTSGQILWVWRYLCCRKDSPLGLRDMLEEDIEKVQGFHNRDLDCAALTFWGKRGVCLPAGQAYLSDAWQNANKSLGHLLSDRQPFVTRRLLEVLPCRLLVPDFPNSFFEEISDGFANEKHIGIVFNSYNPQDGCERVYLNERARHLLHLKSPDHKRFNPGNRSSYREHTIYEDISPEAVRDALWVYQYGFGRQNGGFLDGAYFRDIILSELTPADRIYVVRPLHFHWSGELPQSWPEMEDLKTKVSFNGCYSGERHQIDLVNKLLKHGALNHTAGGKGKYHPIHLEVIEMERARGFFGYVFEDLGVFDDAYRVSMDRLEGKARRLTAKV